MADSGARSATSLDGARFPPGSILAGRYRLVALLGRGGMGEVYRAEDLKLGEAVAVKFLPEDLSMDGGALARFHREVRIARQIAHRNVCRVHDIGEAEGHHFLTMEYIDGEDLKSLLLRIGRLPPDKALELARQICAGLAAAHEAGVLHRDLKPANVMIDGRGRAKITDFGLAHLQHEWRNPDDTVEQAQFLGTPDYMAPEQLRGEEATHLSDIYALGLVLYEMFTGGKAFPNEDWRRVIVRGRREKPPENPIHQVSGIDARVGDAILRCLEDQPRDRPRSALQVATLLPGGDPLRAALEAGETPSPEMVADAQRTSALSPKLGLGLVILFVISLLAIHYAGRHITLLGMVDPELPPEILEDRARLQLLELGWKEPAVDDFGRYVPNYVRLGRLTKELDDLDNWRKIIHTRPSLLNFWYRQSPKPLASDWIRPQVDDPYPIPGDAWIELDHTGRLNGLRLDPVGQPPPGEPDWGLVFDLAELDPAGMRPMPSPSLRADQPIPFHDRRWAWQTELDGATVRVEAASFGAQPVYFRFTEPPGAPTSAPTWDSSVWVLVAFLLLLAAAPIVVVRNLKRHRSDIHGGLSLALFIGVTTLGSHLLAAHHLPGALEVQRIFDILGTTAFRALVVFLVYLAIEPPIRGRAPQLIVSWTRLVRGRVSDPLVARDVLLGLALGLPLTWLATPSLQPWELTRSQPWQVPGIDFKLSGMSGIPLIQTMSFFTATAGVLGMCLGLSLLLGWTKRLWLASAIAIVLLALVSGQPFVALVMIGLLARFGLLTAVFAWIASDWVTFFPTTLDPSDWWAWPNSWWTSVMLLAVVIYAYRVAVHGSTEAAAA